MAPSIQVSSADGSVKLFDLGFVICRKMNKANVKAMLSQFWTGEIDHGNGYSWSSFHGLTFGTMPCGLALGFHQGVLTEINLGVALPQAMLEGGCPTRQAIDDEITFVRKVFHDQLKREFGDNPEYFEWGIAWSGFDPKGFTASAVIRYR